MKVLLFFLPFILISSILFSGCLAAGIGAGISSETLIKDSLSPPTLVTFSPDPTNNNKPTLDWRNLTGATKYHIQIDNNPEFTSPVVDVVDVPLSTYTSPSLPDGTYFWRVSGMDEAGNESDFSEVDSLTVDTEPPPVPTFVAFDPDPTNDNTPTLDWDDMTGAVGYHIQIDDDSDFSVTLVDDSSVPLSTYTLLPLVDGTYFWRVGSIDEAGNESDFSSTDNFTIDTEAPEVPTLIPYSPDPTNNKTPTLNWIDVTGAVQYNILIDDDPGFNIPVVDADVSGSTFTPSSLTDGTYHWKVRSIDEAGNESDISLPDSFTVNTVVSGIPTLIPYNPDPTNNKTPTLDWSDVTGAAKYHLQIDDDSEFNSPVVDDNNVLASTYTPSLVTDGTYFWRVSSISEAGDESDFSLVDSFTLDTVALEVPTLVTYSPDPTNNNTPTLDWDDVASAVNYHIQVDDDSDFSSPVVDDSDMLVSNYTPTSTLSDGTHYWRVSSIDEPGNESSFSEADVFTVDTTAPAVPTLVPHPDPTNDNTPTLDWNDITGAVKHRIQIDDNSGFSSPIVDDSDVSVSTYTTSASPDGTYFWRVNSIDAAGNESNFSGVDDFTVDTIIPVTNTVNPMSGSIILESTQILITFSKSMNPSTFSLVGIMASESDGGVWSTTANANDTLTVSPAITWTDGVGKTLTIDVRDIAGNPLSTLSLSYDIFTGGIVYVRDSNGSDTNLGTATLPKKTIQAAIDLADSLYTTAEVHVAEGTYNVSYQAGTHVVIKEGISLYGGYSSTNWNTRDPNIYTTTIQDTSTSGGIPNYPNRAIQAVGTSATIIDGFTINGGGGNYSSAFYNNGSPTIQNNSVNGGSGSSESYGIFALGSATIENNTINGGSGGNNSYGIFALGSPTIKNNTINGGSAGSGSSFGIYNGNSSSTPSSATIENNTINGGSPGSGSSFGIYISYSSPTIRNNIIYGGTGNNNSFGIGNSGSPTIHNNTINGGTGNNNSYGIYHEDTVSPAIENNIVFTSGGSNRYCIYESGSTSDPLSVRNNDLFDCPTAIYFDKDGNCPGGTNCTLAEMESLTDMTVSGNASDTPTFVSKNGPDGNINTMEDNDWHLVSPLSVTEGGLNGAHSAENWGFTTDKDVNPRSPLDDSSTTEWSMGAYEKD